MSGDYLKTMGTPLVRGRELSDEDAANAAYNAAINETFARKYFAGQDPLGRQIDLGGKSTGMLRPYTIVGVIRDQIDSNPAEAPKPLLMLPYQQVPVTSLYYPALLNTVVHFVVKTRGKMAVAPEMRAIFRREAPGFALDNFQTMQEALDQNNFSARLGLYLVGTFAGLAVLMVMAGLFGVLAQAVSYRRREIGVRLALGATPRTILRMFLLQGSRVVGLGLAAGVILALCTGRLVKSFLYGVKPLERRNLRGRRGRSLRHRNYFGCCSGAARGRGGSDEHDQGTVNARPDGPYWMHWGEPVKQAYLGRG